MMIIMNTKVIPTIMKITLTNIRMTVEMIAKTTKKMNIKSPTTIRMTVEMIAKTTKKMNIKSQTTITTTMMNNMDMNTLMIMANTEMNIHHMKKNK